ncbi:hypothetical protein RDWZM_007759 [Blomia tropicalis]|uniref:Uncharacterized protein n=1 Tax=Blomia tropicalis TaxID=40697 RepID=A0A9Q0M352_BLOTA|nr:hypothetical protein RDWZM_007759 [Blomia tropicalis]
MARLELIWRITCIKHTLLVVHLIFILILVVCILTSFILHGINPTLFLLTIFDLNSVIQLSDTLQNTKDSSTTAAFIAINSPSPEFLFVALTLYIAAIFNQIIAIIAILRRHLCALVFTLITNLTIFCMSVTFVKTNLFLLQILLVLLTITYTIMLKQVKGTVQIEEHGNNQYSTIQSRSPENNFHPATIEPTIQQMYQANHVQQHTPNDPKILAPIIYCPHYTESVC